VDWCQSFFFSSSRRHTSFSRDWSSDVCSSDLAGMSMAGAFAVLIAQLVVMAMILVLLVQADWVDLPVLAICLVISGLVFQVGVRSEERRVGRAGRARESGDVG